MSCRVAFEVGDLYYTISYTINTLRPEIDISDVDKYLNVEGPWVYLCMSCGEQLNIFLKQMLNVEELKWEELTRRQ
jgi:hypothetical protein